MILGIARSLSRELKGEFGARGGASRLFTDLPLVLAILVGRGQRVVFFKIGLVDVRNVVVGLRLVAGEVNLERHLDSR